MRLLKLHSSLLAGISNCKEFVKTPGHTGGFYEITCPHGVRALHTYSIIGNNKL